MSVLVEISSDEELFVRTAILEIVVAGEYYSVPTWMAHKDRHQHYRNCVECFLDEPFDCEEFSRRIVISRKCPEGFHRHRTVNGDLHLHVSNSFVAFLRRCYQEYTK